MKKRGSGSNIPDVLMSFMDYLFQKSPYLIFHPPEHTKTNNLKSGYRPETKIKRKEPRKSLNWKLILITPSRKEIEGFVNNWVFVTPELEVPTNKEQWKELVEKYMDYFNSYFLITEQPQTSKGGGMPPI